MRGQPVWEKLMQYAPIEDIGRCEKCAKLFIIAEHEELFDNKNHATLAYERASGVKKLVTVEGIKHFGIYREKRKEAQQLAIDWFNEHLKKRPDHRRQAFHRSLRHARCAFDKRLRQLLGSSRQLSICSVQLTGDSLVYSIGLFAAGSH